MLTHLSEGLKINFFNIFLKLMNMLSEHLEVCASHSEISSTDHDHHSNMDLLDFFNI